MQYHSFKQISFLIIDNTYIKYLALKVYKISKITHTNSFTLLPMASSPFAFITILTTDTVNKTTSDEIAIGATTPCTASQNTSSIVNNNLAA